MLNITSKLNKDLNNVVQHQSMRKGIYLFPNLITTAGLFAGFYAIVAAMKADFEASALALFIAVIMDSLDGRVARLTGTESAFGAQYDSLSDIVCFGVTPALVAYNWSLQFLGKIGWLVAFLYVAATGLRLARFNLHVDNSSSKGYFLGLPCTSAAAVVAGMLWVGQDFAISGRAYSEIIAIMVVILSLLMVSNLRYHSFKQLDLKGNVPFIAIFLVVFIYALVAWNPPAILFSVFFLYALSGILLFVKHQINHSKNLKNSSVKKVAPIKKN